jgi:hypothetical protein
VNTFAVRLRVAAILAAVTVVLPLSAQTPRRIATTIDNRETFVLQGNTRPVVTQGKALDQGPVNLSQAMPRMSIRFKMTAAQQADLEQLLAAQQNRNSPQFGKFLTPEEYGARFGLDTGDIAKVTAWLESNGFSNVQIARSLSGVSFSGTVAQAQAAFRTQIHNFTLNGEPHIANTGDPLLPEALNGLVESVRGLTTFRMKPHARHLQPHFTSSISGDTFLAPDDWATIYDVKPLYGQGLDGSPISGQNYSIVVVGQSDIQLADLQAFRSAAGLPAKNPTVIVPPGDADPGIRSTQGDEGESDLDLEWSAAIAPNANILFVTADPVTGNGVDDSVTYAIDNNVAPVLSTSYGICEADLAISDFNTQNSLFAQANAQGMTIVAAAGDAGAADCDSGISETSARDGLAVDFPASSPYVTGAGGTTLTASGAGQYFSSTNNGYGGSALSYIPETTWNDGFQSAGGGGASSRVAKPSWQTGAGVPNDGKRDVPDVAFTASPNTDGLLYCSGLTCVNGFRNTDQTLNVIGGTSAAAPTLAGVLALLVQKAGTRLGNLNPGLYSLAATTPSAFHDVTTGNNDQACRSGSANCPAAGVLGYAAGPGYDQATGWGSLDAYNFVTFFSEDASQAISFATIASQTVGTNLTLSASASSGLPVAFSSSTPSVCTVSGNSASLVGVGSCTITAGQGGSSIYAAAAVSRTFAVLNVQTITFVPIMAQVVGNTVSLSASSSSGLPVSFSSTTTSVCTVSGTTASMVGVGTCRIMASQNGNSSYGATAVTQNFAVTATATPTALQFVPVTPCRVADTRLANGPFGGPELAAGGERDFLIPNGGCGIPSNAAAYSLNVTVVPDGELSFLAIWPSGSPQPLVSTLNSDGRIKANAAIVQAGTAGGVAVYVTNASNVVLDINGYFVSGNSAALAFYPITPCRIADTRLATGPLGGPSLSGGVARSFPVLSSSCSIPSSAHAYSLNFTAVPQQALAFLSSWPAGQSQPVVSTLNAPTGVVTANAAIVPAGTGGAVNVYATDNSDLVIDVNGYFAPPGPGGLSLYNVAPCRVLDTRTTVGAFTGKLAVSVSPSACITAPTAQAFVLNATVVPPASLSYLTLWPTAQTQPLASTLNAPDGAITSNMAIVPATNGSVSVFSTDTTQLILDISAYFAP